MVVLRIIVLFSCFAFLFPFETKAKENLALNIKNMKNGKMERMKEKMAATTMMMKKAETEWKWMNSGLIHVSESDKKSIWTKHLIRISCIHDARASIQTRRCVPRTSCVAPHFHIVYRLRPILSFSFSILFHCPPNFFAMFLITNKFAFKLAPPKVVEQVKRKWRNSDLPSSHKSEAIASSLHLSLCASTQHANVFKWAKRARALRAFKRRARETWEQQTIQMWSHITLLTWHEYRAPIFDLE